METVNIEEINGILELIDKFKQKPMTHESCNELSIALKKLLINFDGKFNLKSITTFLNRFQKLDWSIFDEEFLNEYSEIYAPFRDGISNRDCMLRDKKYFLPILDGELVKLILEKIDNSVKLINKILKLFLSICQKEIFDIELLKLLLSFEEYDKKTEEEEEEEEEETCFFDVFYDYNFYHVINKTVFQKENIEKMFKNLNSLSLGESFLSLCNFPEKKVNILPNYICFVEIMPENWDRGKFDFDAAKKITLKLYEKFSTKISNLISFSLDNSAYENYIKTLRAFLKNCTDDFKFDKNTLDNLFSLCPDKFCLSKLFEKCPDNYELNTSIVNNLFFNISNNMTYIRKYNTEESKELGIIELEKILNKFSNGCKLSTSTLANLFHSMVYGSLNYELLIKIFEKCSDDCVVNNMAIFCLFNVLDDKSSNYEFLIKMILKKAIDKISDYCELGEEKLITPTRFRDVNNNEILKIKDLKEIIVNVCNHKFSDEFISDYNNKILDFKDFKKITIIFQSFLRLNTSVINVLLKSCDDKVWDNEFLEKFLHNCERNSLTRGVLKKIIKKCDKNTKLIGEAREFLFTACQKNILTYELLKEILEKYVIDENSEHRFFDSPYLFSFCDENILDSKLLENILDIYSRERYQIKVEDFKCLLKACPNNILTDELIEKIIILLDEFIFAEYYEEANKFIGIFISKFNPDFKFNADLLCKLFNCCRKLSCDNLEKILNKCLNDLKLDTFTLNYLFCAMEEKSLNYEILKKIFQKCSYDCKFIDIEASQFNYTYNGFRAIFNVCEENILDTELLEKILNMCDLKFCNFNIKIFNYLLRSCGKEILNNELVSKIFEMLPTYFKFCSELTVLHLFEVCQKNILDEELLVQILNRFSDEVNFDQCFQNKTIQKFCLICEKSLLTKFNSKEIYEKINNNSAKKFLNLLCNYIDKQQQLNIPQLENEKDDLKK